MTAIYRESDATFTPLNGRQIAIIGYGNVGRPMALNLRDSGLTVIIGNVDDTYGAQARDDGFAVFGLAEAARIADIKMLLLPDEVMPEVYLKFISPSLKTGDMLMFASGYNIAFGFIEPPPFVDVVMIAPRMSGVSLRDTYLTGTGFLSFVSVAQDSTGKAWERLLALALGTGTLRAGALEISFRQEAEIDLFVQQAVLPALHSLMYGAAEILVREGYPPEAALMDLYISGELGYALNKAAELGFIDTLRLYSLTGQYGLLSRTARYQDPRTSRQMETTLDEIRTGKFAQEWSAEYANGYPRLEALRTKHARMSLWTLEQQAIAMLRRTSGV
jgi:ketol-acid reductoisomerase